MIVFIVIIVGIVGIVVVIVVIVICENALWTQNMVAGVEMLSFHWFCMCVNFADSDRLSGTARWACLGLAGRAGTAKSGR